MDARDGTFVASYSYLANSPLVSQIEFKSNTTVRLTTTKTYDKLNRLTSIASVGTGSTPSVTSYAYAYNDANQRTRVNLADGSFWIYEYDALGQVKSGKRYWSDWTPVAGQQFEYGFDDIGNRTSTKSGGDERGAALRAAAYSANNLNQITGRDVPAYLNVIGAATATATNVNVNNTLAYRRGEYYRVELNPNNASAAVWQSLTNRAVQSGTTNSVTGNMFLAKQADAFTYDFDGNLTSDGRWTNRWDAENRLIDVTSHASGPSGSRKSLQFGYDWQGRRISKVVSNWTGSAWTRVLHEKFLYDGWNLVAVLNGTNNGLIESFLWGTDLSGSMQGAGGVGGLLAVKAQGVSVTFAAYDGNGNVAGLVNAAGGDALANYEYGPFGENIRASGIAAKANPFRFSTKYQDDETDQLYYGYRYYSLSMGRWPSRDPIEEKGGRNVYAFVRNEPIGYHDFLGLSCCGCDPGRVYAAIIFGERVNVGDKTGTVYEALGSGSDFIEKLEEAFPRNEEIKKLCKNLKDAVEEITKAANYTEKAAIGLMQIYSSTGYSFHIKLNAKYVCCAKNKLPEPTVREASRWVDNEEDSPGLYTVNTMNGISGNLARDFNNAIKEILTQIKDDCAQSTPVLSTK